MRGFVYRICEAYQFEPIQWLVTNKKKVQKDKQRSTKHAHKIKDRVARTPLNTGDELRCS
jgi:hypothetical protein